MLKALLIVSLATFASTYLMKYTDGPLDMFWKLRRKIGIQIDYAEISTGDEYIDADAGFLASLVYCWWCFSTWNAAFWTFAAVVLLKLPLAESPFIWFGAITIAGVIKRIIDGKIH